MDICKQTLSVSRSERERCSRKTVSFEKQIIYEDNFAPNGGYCAHCPSHLFFNAPDCCVEYLFFSALRHNFIQLINFSLLL